MTQSCLPRGFHPESDLNVEKYTLVAYIWVSRHLAVSRIEYTGNI
jgi:hypothetical protein